MATSKTRLDQIIRKGRDARDKGFADDLVRPSGGISSTRNARRKTLLDAVSAEASVSSPYATDATVVKNEQPERPISRTPVPYKNRKPELSTKTPYANRKPELSTKVPYEGRKPEPSAKVPYEDRRAQGSRGIGPKPRPPGSGSDPHTNVEIKSGTDPHRNVTTGPKARPASFTDRAKTVKERSQSQKKAAKSTKGPDLSTPRPKPRPKSDGQKGGLGGILAAIRSNKDNQRLAKERQAKAGRKG